jgi:hypothetical protein
MAAILVSLFPEVAPQQFVPFHDPLGQHDRLAARKDTFGISVKPWPGLRRDDGIASALFMMRPHLLRTFDPGLYLSLLQNTPFTILHGKPSAKGIDIPLILQSAGLPSGGMRDA